MFKKSNKSFTLIELLVAIALIGLIVAIVVVAVIGTQARARDAERRAEIDAIRKALGLYYTEQGKYPTSTDWTKLEEDADTSGPISQALRKWLPSMPRDPLYGQTKNGEPYSYQYKTNDTATEYKIHVEMETGAHAFYETYSSGGGGIVYGGATLASWIQTTQSDFAAGVLSNVDISSSPGDVKLATTTYLETVTMLSDDFEDGTLSPWTPSVTDRAGVGTHTSNSGTHSMYTRWDPVTVDSEVIDLSDAVSAQVDVWIRRGSDDFSEDPDTGENMVVSYLNNAGSWITLETFAGGGTPGEIYTRTYSLLSDAFHSGFRLRFEQTAGSGSDWDYWHIDDVIVRKDREVEEYLSTGDLISSSFDTGQASDFTTLDFTITEPANTDLKFQLRSADTEADLATATWYGPTGATDYYTTSGETINSIHDNHRWVQYRAYFSTTDASVTPALHDITVNYQY